VIVVGTPAARARLRQLLGGVLSIAGEAGDEAEARLFEADAWLVAPASAPPWPPVDRDRMIETLTPREVQVLELLAEGLSNKGIAARLGISDQTVKFHVASIAGKLGAESRTAIVRLAVRRGLITL
jgi:DNA-binding NarL/FixJ family response regulator